MRTLTLATTLLLAACGGGDPDPGGGPGGGGAQLSPIAQLKACVGTGLNDFLGSLDGMRSLFGIALDPAGAAALGVTWTPVSTTVYEFVLPVDLDGDGTPEGRFAGTATFSSDPAGGLDLLDEIGVTWDLEGHPTLTGSGDITVALWMGSIGLWGSIGFTDAAGGCSFDISTTENRALVLEIDGLWPPSPAFRIDGTGVSVGGSAHVEVSLGSDKLVCDADFDALDPFLDANNVVATIAGTEAEVLRFRTWFGENTEPIDCPAAISANHWVGYWDLEWYCSDPAEFGSWVFTITSAGANSVHVVIDNTVDDETWAAFDVDLDLASPGTGTFSFTTDDATTYSGTMSIYCDPQRGYVIHVDAQDCFADGFRGE